MDLDTFALVSKAILLTREAENELVYIMTTIDERPAFEAATLSLEALIEQGILHKPRQVLVISLDQCLILESQYILYTQKAKDCVLDRAQEKVNTSRELFMRATQEYERLREIIAH